MWIIVHTWSQVRGNKSPGVETKRLNLKEFKDTCWILHLGWWWGLRSHIPELFSQVGQRHLFFKSHFDGIHAICNWKIPMLALWFLNPLWNKYLQPWRLTWRLPWFSVLLLSWPGSAGAMLRLPEGQGLLFGSTAQSSYSTSKSVPEGCKILLDKQWRQAAWDYWILATHPSVHPCIHPPAYRPPSIHPSSNIH